MTDSIDKVVAFLLGEGTLDGRWFGDDKHTTECGPTTKYWWRQNLRSVREQIAALRSPQEWLPIDSAPKDGSWVSLLSGEGRDVGAWRDTRYCMIGAPQGSYGPGWVDQNNCLPISGEFEPTHWQPLPPPPAGEKE